MRKFREIMDSTIRPGDTVIFVITDTAIKYVAEFDAEWAVLSGLRDDFTFYAPKKHIRKFKMHMLFEMWGEKMKKFNRAAHRFFNPNQYV